MSRALYPSICHDTDLTPDDFGDEINECCSEIQEACKGWGTDEKSLIKALARRNGEERAKIAVAYEQMFEKALSKVMDSEVGGDLGTALEFLAYPPHKAEAAMLKMACKGMGTNEAMIYPIICGRTNEEIDLLKKTYFDMYGDDLGRVLDGELGGDFEQLIVNCLQGIEQDFDPDFHTEDKVKEDVESLYDAGQGSFGTDEATLFKFLCTAPPEHLKAVNLAYAEEYGFTLTKACEKELKRVSEKAAVFLIGMKLKPEETVAKLIAKATAGLGTNELLLTSTLIRYQSMLPDVDAAHQEEYGKSIKERVISEARGKYETLLVEVVNCGMGETDEE